MKKQPILEKLSKLDKETEELFALSSGLNEEDLKNQSYGWSIIQVYAHLNIAETGSVMYMKKKMLAGQKMKDFNFLGKIRYFFVKGLLQGSLKWKAPKVIAQPNGDLTLKQIKDQWAKTRASTKKYVEEYPEDLLSKAVYKHPFAGRLNLEGAISSFIYHQRHHMHQIKRIKKKIGR